MRIDILSLIVLSNYAQAHGDHHDDDDDHHHDHHNHHHHGSLRRNLNNGNPFSNPGASGQCTESDASYVVGGVTYECQSDFNEKGGQCRTPDKTPEQRAEFDKAFQEWKESKGKGKGGPNGRKLLEDGCGSEGCANIE